MRSTASLAGEFVEYCADQDASGREVGVGRLQGDLGSRCDASTLASGFRFPVEQGRWQCRERPVGSDRDQRVCAAFVAYQVESLPGVSGQKSIYLPAQPW